MNKVLPILYVPNTGLQLQAVLLIIFTALLCDQLLTNRSFPQSIYSQKRSNRM